MMMDQIKIQQLQLIPEKDFDLLSH